MNKKVIFRKIVRNEKKFSLDFGEESYFSKNTM